MSIDTESVEQDAYLDSSRGRRRSSSARSAKGSEGNSKPGPAAAAGEGPGSKLTSLDVLLSMLQSDLGEIQDCGGAVRFFDHPQGLIIKLPGVRLCKEHKMIHSGETCPHC